MSTLVEADSPVEQEYRWTLNFGPQHPATHTTLRLILQIEGERVMHALPDIGYLHSGFEKIGEHLNYNQYVTVTDRMNYISPLANNVAWHHAVETLLGIEVPKRCQYIRTILVELARISDHLLCNGAAALDTGAFTAFLYAFNQRELLYNIFETLCGARFTNSYTRVGGLMYDATPKFIEQVRAFVRSFPPVHSEICRLLNRNRIFVERTKGIGVLSKAEAINRSATGPIARASGVTRDLRKDEPYLAYGDFDFKVICSTVGDCFHRYLVRMDEMLESLKIVEQALENLPAGPVNVPMADRLNEMLARLQDAFALRTRFLADASHELRTPVASLVTTLDVALARPREADAYRRTLETCRADAHQLRHLVEQLMEQVRSQSPSPAEPAQLVDISTLLRECSDSVAPLAQEKQVTIVHRFTDHLSHVVPPRGFRSMVINLLGNAIEYNRPHGTVELFCSCNGHGLNLAVKDTGIGIAPEHLPHVFEPFYRADKARQQDAGHLGLGLSLVNSHIKAMSGTCQVSSEPGVGTDFQILLPPLSPKAQPTLPTPRFK